MKFIVTLNMGYVFSIRRTQQELRFIIIIIIHSFIYLFIYLCILTAIALTPGGSSTAHIDTQTVHTIQQYSTHLHTNCTHNTAVQHTLTHKQYTQYSSTAHIDTQTVHTIQQYSTHVAGVFLLILPLSSM
jgi:hypothetical protein